MSYRVSSPVQDTDFAVSGFPSGAEEYDPGAKLTSRPPSVQVLLSVLDEVDYAVLLVDSAQRVQYANQVARHELGTRHALRQQGQVLVSSVTEQAGDLERGIRSALAGQRCVAAMGPPSEPLSLAFVPLPPHANDQSSDTPLILIVCGKRHVCERLTLHFFCRAQKLSNAEERVLQALCEGQIAEEIAQHHGTCLSTVRSQISSIRHKTGTDSIRKLAARIASLPPMVAALRR